MRTLKWGLFGALFLAVMIVASIGAWLYFDQSGLPDVRAMRGFAYPDAVASLPCFRGNPVIVSYESLGINVRNALSATQAPEDGPSVARTLLSSKDGVSSATFVSRRITCKNERHLHRALDEIRTALRLERMYSKRELFTMLANTAFFGDNTVGVEAASQRFFRKRAAELSIPEAALLVGLISRPAYDSPDRHPDRALLRRNEVIDRMAGKGLISAADAAAAKASPLMVEAG